MRSSTYCERYPMEPLNIMEIGYYDERQFRLNISNIYWSFNHHFSPSTSGILPKLSRCAVLHPTLNIHEPSVAWDVDDTVWKNKSDANKKYYVHSVLRQCSAVLLRLEVKLNEPPILYERCSGFVSDSDPWSLFECGIFSSIRCLHEMIFSYRNIHLHQG